MSDKFLVIKIPLDYALTKDYTDVKFSKECDWIQNEMPFMDFMNTCISKGWTFVSDESDSGILNDQTMYMDTSKKGLH